MGIDVKGIGKSLGKKALSTTWKVGKAAFATSNPYARLFADMIPGMSFNMARKNAESGLNNHSPSPSSSMPDNTGGDLKDSMDNANENLDNANEKLEDLNETLEEIHEMTVVINNTLKNISDNSGKSSSSNNKKLKDIHEMLLVINNTLKKTNEIVDGVNKNSDKIIDTINTSSEKTIKSIKSDKKSEQLLEDIYSILQEIKENSPKNKNSNKNQKTNDDVLEDIHEMLMVINNTLKNKDSSPSKSSKSRKKKSSTDSASGNLSTDTASTNLSIDTTEMESSLEDIHEMLMVINNTLLNKPNPKNSRSRRSKNVKSEDSNNDELLAALQDIHEMLLVINSGNRSNKSTKNVKGINFSKEKLNNRNMTDKALSESTKLGNSISIPKSSVESTITDVHEMLLVINNSIIGLSNKLDNNSSGRKNKKSFFGSDNSENSNNNETSDNSSFFSSSDDKKENKSKKKKDLDNSALKFNTDNEEKLDKDIENVSLDEVYTMLSTIDETLKQSNDNMIEAITNEDYDTTSLKLVELIEQVSENNDYTFEILKINKSLNRFHKTKFNKLIELTDENVEINSLIKSISLKTLNKFNKFIKEYKENNEEKKAIIKDGLNCINSSLANIVTILDRIMEINEEMLEIDRERFTKEKSEEEARLEAKKKEKIKEQLKVKAQGEGLFQYIYKAVREAVISAVKKTAVGAVKLPFKLGFGLTKGLWNNFIKPGAEEGITNFKMILDRRKSAEKAKAIENFRNALQSGDEKSIKKAKKKLEKLGIDKTSIDMIGKGASEAEVKLFKDRLDKKNKAVPFDYETKDAIVNGIPMLLSKIYQALSGEELIHNYEMGRLTSKDEYIESKQTAAKMKNIDLYNSRKKKLFIFNKNSKKFYEEGKKSIEELNNSKLLAENSMGERNLFGNTVKGVSELQREKGFSNREQLRKRFLETAGIQVVNAPVKFLAGIPGKAINAINRLDSTENVNSIDYIRKVHERTKQQPSAPELKLSGKYSSASWLEKIYTFLSEGKLAVSIISKKDKQKQENLLKGSSSHYYGEQVKANREKLQEKIETQNNKYLKQIAKSTTKHEKEFSGYYRWQKAKNIFNTILSIGSSIITSIGGIVSGLWDVGKYIVTGLATYLGFKSFGGGGPGGRNKRSPKGRRGGKLGLLLGSAGLAASVAGMNNMFGDDVDENGEPTATATAMNVANTALGAYSTYQFGKGAYEAIKGTKVAANAASAGAQAAGAGSKMAGTAAKAGSKGLLKGGLKVAGNALRAVPGLGWALSAGMALADGWSAATDDEAIMAQTGKSEVGMYDRIKHGLGGAAAGLVNWIPGLGDVDSSSVVNTGEKLVNFLSGKGWNTDKEMAEDPSKEGGFMSKAIGWLNPLGWSSKIMDAVNGIGDEKKNEESGGFLSKLNPFNWFGGDEKKVKSSVEKKQQEEIQQKPDEMINKMSESNDISVSILNEMQSNNSILKDISKKFRYPYLEEESWVYRLTKNQNKSKNISNSKPTTQSPIVTPIVQTPASQQIITNNNNSIVMDKETSNILNESNALSAKMLTVLENIESNTKANLKKVNEKIVINKTNNSSSNKTISEQELKVTKANMEKNKRIDMTASPEARKFSNT